MTKKDQKKTHKELDEASKSASLEDLIWLYWKKYNRHLLVVVAVVILGFAGFNALNFYKNRQVEKLQEEFEEAQDEHKELAFAERNSKEPLAGVVFKGAADKRFAEAQYDEAIALYRKALLSLENSKLSGRCHMGIGMALILKGDEKGGSSILEKLLNDRSAMGADRGEAGYHLTLLALESGDIKKTKEYLEVVPMIPNAGIWAQKALILKSTTPGLESK